MTSQDIMRSRAELHEQLLALDLELRQLRKRPVTPHTRAEIKRVGEVIATVVARVRNVSQRHTRPEL